MKNNLFKQVFLFTLGLFLFSGSLLANAPIEKPNKKSSEAKQVTMNTLTRNVVKAQIKTLSFRKKLKLFRQIRKETKIAKRSGVQETPKVILYILAVLLPPVAVGIHTSWKKPTLWNLLWTLLFWIPGIVHAFYIILG